MALGQTTRPWKYADPKSKHLCGKIGDSDALHTTDTTLQKCLPLEQMTLNSLQNIECCYFGSDATILHQNIQLCGVGARASSFSLPSPSPPSSPFFALSPPIFRITCISELPPIFEGTPRLFLAAIDLPAVSSVPSGQERSLCIASCGLIHAACAISRLRQLF